jgi:hypothetical protein
MFGPFLKVRNVARWKFDRTEKTYCHRTDKFLCVVGNRAIELHGIEVNHEPIPVVTARESDAIWLRLSEQTRLPRDDAKEQHRQAHNEEEPAVIRANSHGNVLVGSCSTVSYWPARSGEISKRVADFFLASDLSG